LIILENHGLNALFFISGHMAEKLSLFPSTVSLLNKHQIGYHSSSHSVHPTIFEFTDIEDYDEAYRASLERETAHINPLLKGRAGFDRFKIFFPKKE
jgi:hypothetical protein